MKITLKEKYMSPSNEVSYTVFEIDGEFTFKEGQFVMIGHEIEGVLVKRAYSIATTNEEAKKGKIGFYVKKASEKGMSNHLTQVINIGDTVEIAGPYGHLTNNEEQHNILLMSVGSGLGPIIAHYDYLSKSGKFNKIVNLFGERSDESLVEEVQNKFKDTENIKNILFLSRQEKEGFRKGYIQEGIDEALEYLGKENLKIIICGNPKMVDDAIEKLTEKGISKDFIKSEKY